MKIFLIRHGETRDNARRVIQTPEVPLSPEGVDQAERLARRLRRAGVARVLSSDLERAAMTAERIGAATGAPVALEPSLQERNFGALRGTPYDALRERGIDPFGAAYQPPGGESGPAFDARVDRAWASIRAAAAAARGNLAVVTHGLVCRSLALRHVDLPAGAEAPLRFGNTALTVVQAAPPWRVELLNCTAHLLG